MAALQQKNKELSDTDGLPEGWEERKEMEKILKEAVRNHRASYGT